VPVVSTVAVPRNSIEALSALVEVIASLPEPIVEVLLVLVPASDVFVRYDVFLKLSCDVVGGLGGDDCLLELLVHFEDFVD
jgi:hypothetical protein